MICISQQKDNTSYAMNLHCAHTILVTTDDMLQRLICTVAAPHAADVIYAKVITIIVYDKIAVYFFLVSFLR